ncbi:MAG: thiamine pyrophosphate-binding protein [bacterium]|nr:thiamine pyrophosphate-binding protein [bacterium]
MDIHGADLFFHLLHKFGIKRIFGIPGDELEIFDALAHSKIEFVTTRHEQGAAFMAQAVGKVGSLPGVCISTLGPGATNLVTGVADAYQNRSPVIVLSGQIEKKYHDTNPQAHQYINLQKLFSPVTKASFVLRDVLDIPVVLQKAVDIAMGGRPGPVHITLPVDVMETVISKKTSRFSHPHLNPLARLDIKNIQKAIKVLKKSKYPVAFWGGAMQRRDGALVRAFEKARIPVMTSFLGKGSFPEFNSLALGTASRHIKDKLVEVLEKADCFLVFGYDYIEGVSSKIFDKKKIIYFDTVASKVDHLISPAVECVGDVSQFSSKFAEELLSDQYRSNWNLEFISKIKKSRREQALNNQNLKSFPFNPFKIMQTIQKLSKPKDLIVSDVGVHKQVIGLGYQVEEPFGVNFSNGLSSMGFSLPFAAGLRFITPKSQRIISINGDGGFLMNLQELETIKRYNLDVKIIIFVDNSFGMIKANLLQKYKRVKNLDFTNPDFESLASSFGIGFVPVRGKEDLEAALKSLFDSKGPALLAIPAKYA